MARIAGVDIPREKRVVISLTYIYGIGTSTAQKILENGGIIAMPKFAIPGMSWQGYFLDTDNNVFGIFEVDRHAK